MKRKILIFTAVLMAILSFGVVMAAQGGISADVTEAQVGDEIVMNVSIPGGRKDIKAFDIGVDFDKDMLRVISIETPALKNILATATSVSNANENGYVGYAGATGGNMDMSDGLSFEVTFEVISDVKGSTALTLSAFDVYDEENSPVQYEGIVSSVTISMTGTCTHNFVNAATESTLKTSADCTHPAEYYVVCNLCGSLSGETFTVGTPLGHTYAGEDDMECDRAGCGHVRTSDHKHDASQTAYDENFHWNICSCGDMTDRKEHDYGKWNIISQPSESAKGSASRICKDCGYGQTVEFASEEELPKTADNIPWGMILLAAALVVAAVILLKKRKR